MRPSIRRLLLINLLACVGVIMTLGALGSYYLGGNDIKTFIDRELMHYALTFRAILPNDLNVNVQRELNTIPDDETVLASQTLSINDSEFAQALEHYPLQYQIWNNQKKLILYSSGAPTSAFSNGINGFSTNEINGQAWRVYTLTDDAHHRIIMLASDGTLRAWLKQSIAKDNIYMILLLFPIIAILIWLVLAYGLSSFQRIATELMHRAPSYLEPIDQQSVPEEIHELVDELNKLLMRLKSTLDREQRFASDAAHELRTPLAAIQTQAQVAMRASDNPDVTRALQKVMLGIERSTHVIEQLLTLSRAVPGSQLANQSNVNIVGTSKDIIADLIPSALEKNIDIEFTYSDESLQLVTNAVSFGILLRNLVDNAIRYTPDNGKVHVDIQENNDHIILRVRDNGPGIPPKLRARVFERFFRVLGNKAQGSGLGLAIVQQIAQLHNAHVKLGTPDTGKGLQVEVLFPKWYLVS